jgi:pimeloyl-ACP methyl ester carboxylesterase
MRRPGTTPPFAAQDSIAEIRYLPIGGVDQWVMIRGEHVANPPLVMLHGGPGLSDTPFFRRYNAALERHFTVVYWDQRGAGKSAGSEIPRESMNVDRFVADLEQLVDHVRARLGAARVALFGHSWGSVLGCLYAADHPDRVSAYVGSGQIGDWAAGEAASYAYAVALAERRGKRRALAKLRSLGPPPHTAAQMFAERMLLTGLDGTALHAMTSLLGAIVRGREYSLVEIPGMFRAFRASLDAMWDEVRQIDLRERAPVLAVPVFFFLGRHDHWVPPETSLAYYDALVAPAKRLVWFERSGHEPFVDEAGRFDELMIELVRPVAIGAPARAA